MCNNINSHVNTPLKTPDQSVTVCYLELNDIFLPGNEKTLSFLVLSLNVQSYAKTQGSDYPT